MRGSAVLDMGDEQAPRVDGLPGAAQAQVEVTDVATPYTTWRYTRNYRGAYEGWLPVPEVLTSRVEKTLLTPLLLQILFSRYCNIMQAGTTREFC